MLYIGGMLSFQQRQKHQQLKDVSLHLSSPLPQLVQGRTATLQQRPRRTRNKHATRDRRGRSSTAMSVLSSRVSDVTLPKRKLVIHLDARNTILVADSVTQIGVREAFNSYLTGVTWGVETADGEWKWAGLDPTLQAPPDINAVTYYKHCEQRLVRTPSDRGRLRQVTGQFTEDLGVGFRRFLQQGLDNIRWTNSNTASNLVMTDKDGLRYHYILPAVFQLIAHLQRSNREFSIVIRTYGTDAPNILKALETSLQGNHPDFSHLRPVHVNHSIANITRDGDKHDVTLHSTFAGSEFQRVTNHRDIYEMLSASSGVSAIVDDFQHWQRHDYHHTASKPLWIDTSDVATQHVFFDDNLRVTDTDSIVDLLLFDRDVTTARSVTRTSDIKRFENACLVQADLIESTRNREYFIEKLARCEKLYDEILREALT